MRPAEHDTLTPQIDALKRHLLSARNSEDGSFAEVFHHFLDVVFENPELAANSELLNRPPGLAEALDAALEHVEPTVSLKETLFLEQVDHGLIHGAFRTEDKQGSFFWFDDPGCGLGVLVSWKGEALYFRMTLMPLNEPEEAH